MTIDPNSYTPIYVQLADIIRERIEKRRYAAGQILPSETQLMQEFSVARVTVRKALGELQSVGLVVTKARQGTFVREEVEREKVVLGGSADVIARMPTPRERRELGIAAGVPVLVVEREGQAPEVLPADRKAVRIDCEK